MKKFKVDRNSFYNLMEDLFNQIYGKDYVRKREVVKEDNASSRDTVYVENIRYLETQDGDEILKSMQVSRVISNKGVKGKERDLSFNVGLLNENQVKMAISEDVFDYNFLVKVPAILESVNVEENRIGNVLIISDELREIIVEELVNYDKRDVLNQEEVEISLYEKSDGNQRVLSRGLMN